MDSEKFTFSYFLSLENFKEFNEEIALKSTNKAKKKSMIFGVIEIIIALLYMGTFVLMPESASTGYLVLAILVLCVGLFSFLYYPVFFKKRMEKQIVKVFHGSDYFKSEIHLSFFGDYLLEETDIGDKETYYSKFIGLERTKNMIVLLFNQTSGVTLPIAGINPEEVEELWVFLSQKVQNKP